MKIDIGYEFKDVRLLVRALTHRSASREHNEEIEWFGDSVMDLYVASRLMALMPGARESTLSKRRSEVTCDRAMTELARRAGLDKALVVGNSVKEVSPRLLADAMEAVIGAAFLDGGFTAVKAIDEHLGLVK